jgi:hypothetical protein
LDLGLEDVEGVIFEVVVDGALAETVVFIWALDDGLLEKCAEVEDLD